MTVLIRAGSSWRREDWEDLWRHRELLGFLVWRDLKVRYRQTLLGAAWALLQPLAWMALFSLVLGRWAGIPSEGMPYPLFVLSALVPWTYFANAVSAAGMSLVEQRHILAKIWFPRLLLPAESVLSGLLDLGLGLCALGGLMAYYGARPTAALLWLPVLAALAAAAALGTGLWLAALNARYRDVRYALPFLLQLWLFATPVAYPAGLVPGRWRLLVALNPMSGIVEGFRWALTGRGEPPHALGLSAAVILAVLAGGAVYFRRTERVLTDIL